MFPNNNHGKVLEFCAYHSKTSMEPAQGSGFERKIRSFFAEVQVQCLFVEGVVANLKMGQFSKSRDSPHAFHERTQEPRSPKRYVEGPPAALQGKPPTQLEKAQHLQLASGNAVPVPVQPTKKRMSCFTGGGRGVQARGGC